MGAVTTPDFEQMSKEKAAETPATTTVTEKPETIAENTNQAPESAPKES